jgi:hypothetical protein
VIFLFFHTDVFLVPVCEMCSNLLVCVLCVSNYYSIHTAYCIVLNE